MPEHSIDALCALGCILAGAGLGYLVAALTLHFDANARARRMFRELVEASLSGPRAVAGEGPAPTRSSTSTSSTSGGGDA